MQKWELCFLKNSRREEKAGRFSSPHAFFAVWEALIITASGTETLSEKCDMKDIGQKAFLKAYAVMVQSLLAEGWEPLNSHDEYPGNDYSLITVFRRLASPSAKDTIPPEASPLP